MIQNTNVQVPIEGLQASQLELVVSEKTIGSLTTNAKQIRELVQDALPKYDISNYSTDDVVKAKSDKAMLNKAAKMLNDKRIEFEREFMAPFGEFKEVVTDTVNLIKVAIDKIDTVIKADEERSKKEKRVAVEKLAETCGVEDAGIQLSMIWNDKWLNKSTSMKSIESEIKQRMSTIAADIDTLKSFAEDFDVLVVRYKENFNLQETVRYANQLKEQREAKMKEESNKPVAKQVNDDAADAFKQYNKQAESLAEEKQEQHSVRNAERDAADAFADILGQSADKPDASKHTARLYEITATPEQFCVLEQYFTANGISFTIKKM